MKIIILVCIFTVAMGYYTDMDETVDVSKLAQDSVKMREFFDCFLDKKPCIEPVTGYRKHVQEAFDTACKRCDDRMKHMIEEFILDSLVKYPDELAEVRSKYDPDGTRFSKLVSEIAKY